MRKVFLGKPLHWLLWGVIVAVLVAMGAQRLHTVWFNLFGTILLVLTTACVLVVVFTTRKGERITREPFDEE